MKRPFLSHYMIEISGISKELLKKDSDLTPQINEFIERVGLTVVSKISHNFTPYGTTLVFVLSESHFAVHTWPEHNYIHLDLLSCKDVGDDESLKKIMKDIFKSDNLNIKRIRYE